MGTFKPDSGDPVLPQRSRKGYLNFSQIPLPQLMFSSALQTQAQEIVVPTSKLLDFLIPLFQVLQPNKHFNRRKVNNYIYRKWRDPALTTNIEGIRVTYQGQPGGKNSEHHWRVDVSKASPELREVFEQLQRNSRLPIAVPPTPTGDRTATPEAYRTARGAIEWNGLWLQSPAQVKIAEALDRRQLVFFANVPGRVPTRDGPSRAIDVEFSIVYRGQLGILEVDGPTYSAGSPPDYHRARLFLRQGIVYTRFTERECLDDPEAVVEEFLDLFVRGSLSSALDTV
jgi:hypothetical protein